MEDLIKKIVLKNTIETQKQIEQIEKIARKVEEGWQEMQKMTNDLIKMFEAFGISVPELTEWRGKNDKS